MKAWYLVVLGALLTWGRLAGREAFEIEAADAYYRHADEKIEAHGNVVVRLKNYRLVAQKLTIFLKDNSVEGEDILISQAPFFVHAKSVSGNLDTLVLQDVVLFLDAPGGLRPKAQAKTVTLRTLPKPEVSVQGTRVMIGNLPVFYLAKARSKISQFPLALDLQGDYNRKMGAGLKTSLLLPVSDEISAGGVVDIYSKSGVLIGPKLKYTFDQDEGSLEGGYLNDRAHAQGLDFYDQILPKRRGFLYWKHQSHPSEAFSLISRVTALSDSEIERDVRYHFFEEDPIGGSFLEGIYRKNRYLFTVFTNKRLNSFQQETEHLPELRLDALPQRLWDSPLYTKGFMSVAHLEKQGLRTAQEAHKLDLGFEIDCPVTDGAHGPIGTLKPQISTRLKHYPETTLPAASQALGELGFDWETVSYGQWEVHSKLWRIDGLRHRIRPSLHYRHITGSSSSAWPAQARIEEGLFNPNIPTLDLLRRRDSISPGSTLRLGLENTLQTRDTSFGSRDLISLQLYHDLQTHPSYTLLNVTPVCWLGAEIFTRWDRRTLEEVHARLKLYSHETWTFSLGAHRLRQRIEQYAFSVEYRLNEIYRAQSEFRFDAHTHAFIQHSYRLYARTSQSWETGLSFDFFPTLKDTRERFRFSFKMNILL